MPQPTIEVISTDILILGSGGAGLFAALHAYEANRRAAILISVKGLLGKSGCTRMVQGGYNAVLHPNDSLDQHFRDTIEGGAYLNDQELAWTLITTAPERIRELENRMGCFFDRNPDGTIHQKAFAGQSFDRTVHRGDLTGIEIMTRLMDKYGAATSLRWRITVPSSCYQPRVATVWRVRCSSTSDAARFWWCAPKRRCWPLAQDQRCTR